MTNSYQYKRNREFDSYFIYVESGYNSERNSYIRENHNRLVSVFNKANYGFIYLPFFIQDDNFEQVVSYNRPYLKDLKEQSIIQDIYNKLLSHIKPTGEGGFLCLYESSNFENIYPYDNERSGYEEELISDIELKESEIYETSQPLSRISIRDDRIRYDYRALELTGRPHVDETAQIRYDYEALKLAEEIKLKIAKLYEKGATELIADIIEDIKFSQNKLSTLFITDDYRFFLKDYGMKEVRFGPLAKSLYILYLKHTEGINFKDLIDYRDELLSIYMHISPRENIDRMKTSINALSSPLSNSINENSSRIKSAFVEQITDNLAYQYYITGNRGETKLIQLDRSLVEFQDKLPLF